MSKIIRDESAGSPFEDTLGGAAALRDQLLRSTPKIKLGRDARREEGRAEGIKIGYAEGLVEGQKEGRQQSYAQSKAELDRAHGNQIQQFAEGINDAMRQFEEQREQWFVHAEEKLAGLAIEIARRAISKELETSRESVVEIAHQVLEELTESSRVRLRVNPIDGSVMEARLTEIRAAFSNLQNIEIVEDRNVGFGCCLETDAGMIDARVENYLARIVSDGMEGR